MSDVLARTLHLIPDSVLDAPPPVSDVLPACSFGGIPGPADRAGFSKSLGQLRLEARAAAERAHAPRPGGKRTGGQAADTADCGAAAMTAAEETAVATATASSDVVAREEGLAAAAGAGQGQEAQAAEHKRRIACTVS